MRNRVQCPLVLTLSADGIAGVTGPNGPVPFQAHPLSDGQVELRLLIDRLAAGSRLELTAETGAAAAAADEKGLTVDDDGRRVAVNYGQQLVGAYHYADPDAARPYWYPVPDPYGNPVTRGWPMHEIEGEKRDHKHHRSLWVAYGEVNDSDNWSEDEGHGTQTHEGWNVLTGGAVCAVLDQNVVWRNAAGDALLNEHRVWRIYQTPAAVRLWDLDIDLNPAAGAGDVTFGDTKEGGLCSVRVATTMDVPEGRIENALGGINEGETWGRRAAWCDYSGYVKGNWVGIAVFDHPTNFRHPTWWHVRNYGLMSANCFGLSHFTNGRENGTYVLPQGQTMRFRYRIYVHPGDATAGGVETRYHDFANPPSVKVEG